MKQVTIAVIGAGSRGHGFANIAAGMPERAKIVGVAEPRESFRNTFLAKHPVDPQFIFTDWRDAADRPRFADAVLITTQDAMHVEPAEAFAAKGYHIMLEKPMAPTEEGCRRIVSAVKAAGVIFAVGHVLRYTPYTVALKRLLDSGAIGEVVSIQHLEALGFWHQAHSYVRGNWRNEAGSSPMLLAKSCHDLDWLRYLMGKRCLQVSSFGNLKHFRPEHRPEGATERCLDCPVETCPYSASRFYLGMVERGECYWPVDVLTANPTVETVTEALRTRPYGRCVYACDNDVVDHQVVNMLFEGGSTAGFTMTGFNRGQGRITRIFGTHGEIYGDFERIEHFDYLTKETKEVDIHNGDQNVTGGHGGGDGGLLDRFIAAVAENDPSRILSGPDETLETHLMVFAAERARREGKVEDVVVNVPV